MFFNIEKESPLLLTTTASHPSLSRDQVAVIEDAIDVASPDAFTAPVSAAHKAEIARVFEKTEAVLGKAAATELFITLGPKTITGANPLPIAFSRLASCDLAKVMPRLCHDFGLSAVYLWGETQALLGFSGRDCPWWERVLAAPCFRGPEQVPVFVPRQVC